MCGGERSMCWLGSNSRRLRRCRVVGLVVQRQQPPTIFLDVDRCLGTEFIIEYLYKVKMVVIHQKASTCAGLRRL